MRFLGMGVSGGIHAFENGFSLMLGGNPEAYQYIIPVLESLIKPNGIHTYFGKGGAGHFVQMVASGIEAGMMQAIAEGLSIASKSDYQLNLMQATNTWQAGSSISSFLLDMVIDSLSDDPTLAQFDGSIKDNHEANFALEQAKATNLSVPVTEQSVEYRNRSQYDKLIQDTLIAKLIQAMLYEYVGE